jgi:scyllo-inositol 2-dehydrogenase (NADP+)
MIKTAIVGYGRSARVYHLPFLNFSNNFQVTSFLSTNPERLKKDYPKATVHSETSKLLLNQDFDLAIITSPVFAHYQQVKLLLEARKHVVVEKPFTVTSAEAKELADLAITNQVILSVFHNRRWDAGFQKVKELYQNGEIGKINHFEVHFDRWRPNTSHAWREDSYPGSGLVYELGVHFIDQALQLFGKPDSINVDLQKQRAGSQIDDYYHIIFNYPNSTAILHSTCLARTSPSHLLVHGENFDLEQKELDSQEQLLINDIPVGSKEWVEKNKTQVTIYKDDSQETFEIVSSYGDFYESMAEAIHSGKASPVNPYEIVTVMEIVEEIYKNYN